MAEKNHEKKQEIRADREKFQVETKRENISRIYKWVLWDICDYRFTIYVCRWWRGETLKFEM